MRTFHFYKEHPSGKKYSVSVKSKLIILSSKYPIFFIQDVSQNGNSALLSTKKNSLWFFPIGKVRFVGRVYGDQTGEGPESFKALNK